MKDKIKVIDKNELSTRIFQHDIDMTCAGESTNLHAVGLKSSIYVSKLDSLSRLGVISQATSAIGS